MPDITLTPEQQADFRELYGAQEAGDYAPFAANDTDRFVSLEIADGNQSCTHPTWVYVAERFAGYQHWMAATPFPTQTRENPHLWCSHDAKDWITPPGASNPVMQPGLINGHTFTAFSDPCLFQLHTTVSGVGNAGDLVLTARPMYPDQEGLYFRTTSDAINWTPYVEMMYAARPGGGYAILSQSVVQEDDGTFSMWICTGTGMTKQTSPDLQNWSDPVACVFKHSLVGNVWHGSVKKINGVYVAQIVSLAQFRTHWVSAEDGINFTGRDGAYSVVPQKTLGLSNGPDAYDKIGQYRGDFIPSPTKPGTFDLLVPQISSQKWDDPATAATNVFNAAHRIQLFREADLGDFNLHVTRNGASNITLSTVDSFTKVTGFQDSVSAECFDSVNDRFQPKESGWFVFSPTVQFSSGSADAEGHVAIFKNGSFHMVVASGCMKVGHQPFIGGVTPRIFLSTSDYIEVFAKTRSTSATDWKVAGGSRLGVAKAP